MSPKELYFATRTITELREKQGQHDYEVARFTAVNIINLTSTILKEQITDPRKLVKFPWEAEIEQTVDEMKNRAMAMARAFGAVVTDKSPDDPPRILAPKFKK